MAPVDPHCRQATSWWSPSQRRDPNDARVLREQRRRDEHARERRLAVIEGRVAVCPECRRPL